MNASSTCAFSEPVWRHCSTNCVFDRFVMAFIVKIDTGIVTSATSARSGEIVIIMISTPTSVSVDVSSWLSVCWRLCARLSMSLVTRLSMSPRGWRSTYRSGIRLSLSSTSERSRNIARCTTPASRYACRYCSTADAT